MDDGSVRSVRSGEASVSVDRLLPCRCRHLRPRQATGLDGALRRLATQTGALVVVVIIGVGFVAYGAFCLATFTHRRLQAP